MLHVQLFICLSVQLCLCPYDFVSVCACVSLCVSMCVFVCEFAFVYNNAQQCVKQLH